MGTDQVPLSEMAHSLGPVQYGRPVTEAAAPILVNCWIHTRKGHHLVGGAVVAWTPKAVRVRYLDDHGREGYVWVWANAVIRR